jgi:hypothetical protein
MRDEMCHSGEITYSNIRGGGEGKEISAPPRPSWVAAIIT